MHILEVNSLTKIFNGSFTAVDNISFELKKGEVLGLLGANGAGKTTTIQMLLGLLTPTSGQISYFGENFFKNRSQIMERVSFASSYLKLPASLTVRENLDFYGRLYGLSKDLKEKYIAKNLELFDIVKNQNQLTRSLSAGQLTRLMLAKAFLANPSIVLLDEPTAALDPEIAFQVRKFVLEQKNSFGTSMLFTSHNMAEVEEICDRVLILRNGKIIDCDTPSNLASKMKRSRLHLLVAEDSAKLEAFLNQQSLIFKISQNSFFEIDLQEDEVCLILAQIMSLGLKYSQISVQKPTLEDYFLDVFNKKS